MFTSRQDSVAAESVNSESDLTPLEDSGGEDASAEGLMTRDQPQRVTTVIHSKFFPSPPSVPLTRITRRTRLAASVRGSAPAEGVDVASGPKPKKLRVPTR